MAIELTPFMHWTNDWRLLLASVDVVVTTRSPIRSSVGLKAVMAVTGGLLVLFLSRTCSAT